MKIFKKQTISILIRVIHQMIVCAQTEHEKAVMKDFESLFLYALRDQKMFLAEELETILDDREKYQKKVSKNSWQTQKSML